MMHGQCWGVQKAWQSRFATDLLNPSRRLYQPPLEQFPVAIDRCERGRDATGEGWSQRLFGTEVGIERSVMNATKLMTSGPPLIDFLLFQRQFDQSLVGAPIK